MKSTVSPVPSFELAVRYLPLVEAAVVRVCRQVGGRVDWNHLIAIGALSLHEAANRYSSSERAHFATHAKRCIRGAILDSLGKQVRTPGGARWRQVRNSIPRPVYIPGSILCETEPGAEFSGTLQHLRKLLGDPRCVHEAL